MVSTRKTPSVISGVGEEPNPTTVSPKKSKHAADSSPTKAEAKGAAGRKRKTEGLTQKDEKPTKQPKKVAIEEETDVDADPPKRSLKQTTRDHVVVPNKPQRSKVVEEVEEIEAGISNTELLKAADATEDKDTYVEDRSEEQLKAESRSAVSVSLAREEKVEKSPIMEKGIMYFFFRPKVAVEHAESLDDVQRLYIVLRPLPLGAKLTEGKIQDEGNNRLIVVPKKRLPVRGYEKFLTFVEEPKISVEDLKNKFLKGSTYITKTQGERKNSALEPIGEGIYAITRGENKKSSHLAYILTIPDALDDLQKEFGLKARGSFVTNVKNPSTPAPPQAGIPDPAAFPKEIMNEFRGLRWGPLEPKHLDYKHAEVLFIGEKEIPSGGELDAIVEEMEKLEDEDEVRVKHLNGNDAVFVDLELDKKEFAEIGSTW